MKDARNPPRSKEKKKHMVASDETKCQGLRQPLHHVIETDRKRGEAVSLGQDSFPDVSAFRILAVTLEICLLPGKPIGLLITLEWIGPAQHGGCLQEGEEEGSGCRTSFRP